MEDAKVAAHGANSRVQGRHDACTTEHGHGFWPNRVEQGGKTLKAGSLICQSWEGVNSKTDCQVVKTRLGWGWHGL